MSARARRIPWLRSCGMEQGSATETTVAQGYSRAMRSAPRGSATSVPMSASCPRTPRFAPVRRPVVQPSDRVPDSEPESESVNQPHEAADKRHAVSDEYLAQQREVRADDVPAFDDEPGRGHKKPQA